MNARRSSLIWFAALLIAFQPIFDTVAGDCGVHVWMKAVNGGFSAGDAGFKPFAATNGSIPIAVYKKRTYAYGYTNEWTGQSEFYSSYLVAVHDVSTGTGHTRTSTNEVNEVEGYSTITYPSYSSFYLLYADTHSANLISYPQTMHPYEKQDTKLRSDIYYPNTPPPGEMRLTTSRLTQDLLHGTNILDKTETSTNSFSPAGRFDTQLQIVSPTLKTYSAAYSTDSTNVFNIIYAQYTNWIVSDHNVNISLELTNSRTLSQITGEALTLLSNYLAGFTVTNMEVCAKVKASSYLTTNDIGAELGEIWVGMGGLKYAIQVYGHKGEGVLVEWVIRKKHILFGLTSEEKKKEWVICNGEVQTIELDTVLNTQIAGFDQTVEVELLNKSTCNEFAQCDAIKVYTGSAVVEMGLGFSVNGLPPGFLFLRAETPSPSMFTPSALQVVAPVGEGVGAIARDTNGVIRQILGGNRLLDIVTISTNKYEVRYYIHDNVYQTQGTNGLFSVSGTPSLVNTLEQVGSNTNLLRITSRRGSNTNTWDFEYAPADQGWWLITEGGLRREFKGGSTDEETGIRTEITFITGSDEVILYKVRRKFFDFGGTIGERMFEETIDPDGFARTTSWSYFTDFEEDGDSYGKTKQVIYPEGRWERYEYDSIGRTTKLISQFGNSATNAADSASRVIEYTYTSQHTNDDLSMEPDTARRTVEKLLGSEIRRSYTVISPEERKEIQCQTPGAAITASDNLVTITTSVLRYDSEGNLDGVIYRTLTPDGLLAIYEKADRIDGSSAIDTSYSGVPNETGTAVTDGTKSITLVDANRLLIASSSYDVATGVQLSGNVYTYNSDHKVTRIDHFDGTATINNYDCCKLESTIDPSGVQTTYVYDTLQRQVTTIRDGITYSNNMSVDGRLLASYKMATNTSIVTERNGYDSSGRLIVVTNALDQVIRYYESVDGSGQLVRTTTNSDNTTEIQTSYKDGSLKSITGTATHGTRYEYGVETVDSVDRAYTKEIRLLDNGSDSAEWIKNYTDMLGRGIKTVYADGASSRQYYNTVGRLWKTVDPDGVVTLFQYDSKGEVEYSALDMNRNDQIDFGGSDRITRTVSDILESPSLVSEGPAVQRSRTYAWLTDSQNTATLLSTSEQSVDGKYSWSSHGGLLSASRMVQGTNGWQFMTNSAPDGSKTIQESQYGRVQTVTWKDANGVQLSRQTYLYDRFKRYLAVTDARNGASAMLYDLLDRPVVQVVNLGTVSYTDSTANLSFTGGSTTLNYTNPYSVSGFPTNSQVMTTWYDNRGQAWRMQQPDNTSVTNEFFSTGELQKTYGSRNYPVEYSYDYAGRMKTMKTWQDFSGNSGTATTTWSYSTNRGFMTSKRYADSKGPDYTYTTAGRLATRTWARGAVTTYGYNDGGDQASFSYSDGTAGVTNIFNRRGQVISVTQGTNTTAYVFNTLGLLLSESYTGGPLNGLSITNSYDALWRRSKLGLRSSTGQTPASTFYAYDAGSRLRMVSDGVYQAAYRYHTNSSLIQNVSFRQFGGPIRLSTEKSFDTLNRLMSVSNSAAASFSYTYNSANQRTKNTLTDGSYWVYAYDSLGQVTSGRRYWSDDTEVAGQQFDYSFDDIGNRKTAHRPLLSDTRRASYSANLLNQYTNRTVPGFVDVLGTAHTNATITINSNTASRKGPYFSYPLTLDNSNAPVYAAITNIATLLGAGVNTNDILRTNIGKSFLPQTPEAYSYDDDGNLTADGRWTFTWDGENRVTAFTGLSTVPTAARLKVENKYDNQCRRIQKITSAWNGSSYVPQSTNRFVYDGWNLVAILNPDSSVLAAFTWGIDLSGSLHGAGGVSGLISMKVQSGTNAGTYFYSYDGNGNVSTLINAATGAKVAEYEYGPFGEVLRATGPLAFVNPFRFSTKYQDDEAGFLYYGYRFYDPSVGRWLGRDPIREQGGMNLYGALENDMISAVDLLGLTIAVDCPVGYFKENGITPDMYSYDAASFSWVANPNAPSAPTSGDGLILWRMLSTKHKFTAREMKVDNLKKHVAARKTIVENTLKADFLFDTNQELKSGETYDNPQAFFNKLNTGSTVIACQRLTRILFETGNNLGKDNGSSWAQGQRDYDSIWIPGDWGYLKNLAFTEDGDWNRDDGTDAGLQGENLIYTGNNRFWGHFKDGVHPAETEQVWFANVKKWTSQTKKQGIPSWRQYIIYPVTGLQK